MKITFFGDIMGRSGRRAVCDFVHKNEELKNHFLVANAENATHGYGINKKHAKELLDTGIHVLTMGNHTWDQKETPKLLETNPQILRPLNAPSGTPGRGYIEYEFQNKKILVISLLGQLFMEIGNNSPFEAVDNLLKSYKLGHNIDAILVDTHAETTSEKYSLAHFLDGRVSMIVGSHTHVPTNDAHILEKGTAYMTDTGMNGDFNSVIGLRKDLGIKRFIKKHEKSKLEPADGQGTVCGVTVDINERTGFANSIHSFVKGPLHERKVV